MFKRMILSVSVAIAILSSADASGRELPELKLHNPIAKERIDPYSNLLFQGKLSRPLGLTIGLRLCSVTPEGKLLLFQWYRGVRTDENGQFSLSVGAPGSGWPAGKWKAMAEIEGISQVSDEIEFEIVARRVGAATLRSADKQPSSGVIVDMAKPLKGYRVPPGKSFVVRGDFEYRKNEKVKDIGPWVMVKIQRQQSIYRSVLAATLGDAANQRYWFEIVVDAPDRPLDAELNIGIPAVGKDGRMVREQHTFALKISDEELLTRR